jgi:hypothetical protein
MTGELAFLKTDGVDAAAELKALLDDEETYEAAWTLLEHLRKTARDTVRHNKSAQIWKSFVASAERTYPVFVTATDPFVVYLVTQIAESRAYRILAVQFGRFTGEPTEKFYDRIWTEAERRLRLLKW